MFSYAISNYKLKIILYNIHFIFSFQKPGRKPLNLCGAEEMQGLEEGILPESRKTRRQVPNQGRELT